MAFLNAWTEIVVVCTVCALIVCQRFVSSPPSTSTNDMPGLFFFCKMQLVCDRKRLSVLLQIFLGVEVVGEECNENVEEAWKVHAGDLVFHEGD